MNIDRYSRSESNEKKEQLCTGSHSCCIIMERGCENIICTVEFQERLEQDRDNAEKQKLARVTHYLLLFNKKKILNTSHKANNKQGTLATKSRMAILQPHTYTFILVLKQQQNVVNYKLVVTTKLSGDNIKILVWVIAGGCYCAVHHRYPHF